MNQEEFDSIYGRVPSGKQLEKVRLRIEKRVKNRDWYKKRLLKFIPILYWLPRYDIKTNLISDLLGGLTVGIMHVPQG